MSQSGSAALSEESTALPPLRRVMGPKLLLLFIVGDILGTGAYTLTGSVAGELGGAAWGRASGRTWCSRWSSSPACCW